MTKARRPLSVDAAIARIAGQVPGSWKAMAQAVGYDERTVRKWGDEDDDANVNVPAAIKLDMLFQQNGGEGRPIYDAYGLLLGAAITETYADRFDMLRRLIRVVKETGEAESAIAMLILPDATAADQRAAQKEVLEALEELKNILPFLDPASNPLLTAPAEQCRAPP